MVSLGFIYGFFWVQLGLHVGFLMRISFGFLWVSGRVSLGFHLGYKQNRIKQKNKKETVKTGSKEANEQEVEQQKHMTGERNSRIVEVERHRSTKAEKQGKQRSRKAKKQEQQKSRKAGKAEKQGKQKAEKQRIRKAEKQEKQRSKTAESREVAKQKIRETGKHRNRSPKKKPNLPRKNSPPYLYQHYLKLLA